MSAQAATLIGRDQEQQELRRLSEGDSRGLALVTGRRRVGKTFLLTHTWPPDQYFLFTASRTSPEFNRQQLLKDLSRYVGTDFPAADYPTWRSIFNLLLDLDREQPLVVVFDEFQYLAESEAGLAEIASELNSAWERARPQRPFTLVLAGSAVGTIQGLATGGAPLYGRFDLQLKLQPLDYLDASALATFHDPLDRAIMYGTFGGMPRYLAAIDPAESLERNITRLMLSPQGQVRLLLETALDQEEGLRDIASYNAILRAVATGSTSRNEIAQQAGLKNDSALNLKIGTLVELGYLTSHRNIGAPPNAPYRYRLNDPALRFHQRFVQPNTSLLEREPPETVWPLLQRHLPGYMGLEFEQITRQAYSHLREQYELPMVREWRRWEGTDRTRKSLEIDVVAPLLEEGVLTGAIKWNSESVTPELHYAHLQMLQRAADAGQKWAHQALEPHSPLLYVSASGFDIPFRSLADKSERRIILLELADMYSVVRLA